MAYAHSRNAQGRRQGLEDHIRAVAALTEGFASAFNAGPLGRLLGLCHDIGKYDPAWQAYLLASEAGTIKRGRAAQITKVPALNLRRYTSPSLPSLSRDTMAVYGAKQTSSRG